MSEQMTAYIGIKLTKTLGQQLKDAAWQQRLTTSEFVRRAVQRELEQRGQHNSAGVTSGEGRRSAKG